MTTARDAQPVVRIQRLSWAGVQVATDQVSLFIDPWISASIWDGTWTAPIAPLEPATRTRFVAITHLHNDHFDRAAVRELLAEGGSVVCETSHAAYLAGLGFVVRPVALNSPVVLGDLTLTPVLAEDGLGDDQVSWVIRAGGLRLIHAGDSLWHGRWRAIGRQHGPLDVGFLPINGARIPRLLPEGVTLSMTPTQALGAAELLDVRRLVPIHYGAHQPGEYEEEPDALEILLTEASRRGIRVDPLEPGEWLDSPGE